MKLNDFVLNSMKKVRSEVIESKAWSCATKPVSEITENEIFELQCKLIDVVHQYGKILEFMETWKLFTNED